MHSSSEIGTPRVSLADIANLAFPAGSRVHPAKGASRGISWTAWLVRGDQGWAGISAGDCALFGGRAEDIDTELVDYLRSAGAAAFVIPGRLARATVDRITGAGIVVVTTPAESSLRAVERAVVASIVNRQAELDQRGVQIYRQLAELVQTDKGIGAIVVALHEITDRCVLLESEDGGLRFHAGTMPEGGREAIANALAATPAAPMLAETPLSSTAPPVVERSLEPFGWDGLTAPIIVDDRIAAFISLAAPSGHLNELDEIAVSRAAAVCAIEISKQRAVSAAATRLRGDFFTDVLIGSFVTEDAVERRARTLGIQLALPSVVVSWRVRPLLRPEPVSISAVERLVEGEFTHSGGRHLVRATEDRVIALYPLRDRNVEPARIWAQRARARSGIGEHLAIGIGRAAERVRDVQRSFEEAEHALELASGHWSGDAVVAYDDLGVYRLLVPMRESRELALFYADTIGVLVEHERTRRSRLVPTLRALLNQNGNVSRTAEVLGIHRNTLLQRIERIEAITGMNLDEPDSRLNLQLGLKISVMLDKDIQAR